MEYVNDLRNEVSNIERFTRGGRDVFLADVLVQYGVAFAYVNNAEIIKRIDPLVLAQLPEVNWRRLILFRDFLAHNYDRVNLTLVWEAVEQLPELKAAIESLAKKVKDLTDGDT
ncbi:MAG: DUF86 domain-containing protein [Anaerolineae bacterium]|nr:DUF86 domain-containing protein [Anaerolineae bacterium]